MSKLCYSMWLTTTGDFASGLSPHPLTDFTTNPQLLLLLPFSQILFFGREETEHQLEKGAAISSFSCQANAGAGSV